MSKGKSITLAIFTAWPLCYIIFFICFMIYMTFFFSHHASGPPKEFIILFSLHLFTMLEMLVLIAIYIVFLFKTDRIPQDKKALWAAVLFLGNIFAMPVFWYLYIWKEPVIKSLSPTNPVDEKGDC